MAPAVFDFQNAYEVEFRLTEVIYMLAECRMRAGASEEGKRLVDQVRKRYYTDADWSLVEMIRDLDFLPLIWIGC
ncbi:MAG: RagB/SusD family nutrient uptake outer membrane protein [Tannerellaceae bacterium]|nr:RagB/SusD family nutrient uptake outer membrane protein [Tannerellaceae bacterium]